MTEPAQTLTFELDATCGQGQKLLDRYPELPRKRRCTDPAWVLLPFLAVTFHVCYSGYLAFGDQMGERRLYDSATESSRDSATTLAKIPLESISDNTISTPQKISDGEMTESVTESDGETNEVMESVMESSRDSATKPDKVPLESISDNTISTPQKISDGVLMTESVTESDGETNEVTESVTESSRDSATKPDKVLLESISDNTISTPQKSSDGEIAKDCGDCEQNYQYEQFPRVSYEQKVAVNQVEFSRSVLQFWVVALVTAVLSPFISLSLAYLIASAVGYLLSVNLGFQINLKRQIFFYICGAVAFPLIGLGCPWWNQNVVLKVFIAVSVVALILLRLAYPALKMKPREGSLVAKLKEVFTTHWTQLMIMADYADGFNGYYYPPKWIAANSLGLLVAFLFCPVVVLSFVAFDAIYETNGKTFWIALSPLMVTGLWLSKFAYDFVFVSCVATATSIRNRLDMPALNNICGHVGTAIGSVAKSIGTLARTSTVNSVLSPLRGMYSGECLGEANGALVSAIAVTRATSYTESLAIAQIVPEMQKRMLENKAIAAALIILSGYIGLCIGSLPIFSFLGTASPFLCGLVGMTNGIIGTGALLGLFAAFEPSNATVESWKDIDVSP